MEIPNNVYKRSDGQLVKSHLKKKTSAIAMSTFIFFTFLVVASAKILPGITYSIDGLKEPDSLIIDGVSINSLNEQELKAFINAEDEKLYSEINIWVGKQDLAERKEKNRVKRIAPLVARAAWTVGRALFKSFSRSAPKLSRSAGKLTKQYNKQGNFGSTLRDFRSFKPDKGSIKTFRGNNGLKGVQGTFGNGKWTVKARSSSSSKRPTLDIYRSNKADRSVLRKIRYDN